MLYLPACAQIDLFFAISAPQIHEEACGGSAVDK